MSGDGSERQSADEIACRWAPEIRAKERSGVFQCGLASRKKKRTIPAHGVHAAHITYLKIRIY
ncbi:hypothetical protein A1351_20845 [Methylosinus sp. R-45379]|nr:hypothetical protein A1351_20845 [Methylosinus sp. R-45379]